VSIARLWLVLGMIVLGGLAGAQEPQDDPAEPAQARRPNLILISMDTTRADALSSYGQPVDIRRQLPPVTPHLDALAAGGLRFEHFYAHAPTTLSSHSSMLTGLDPHEHGVPRNGFSLAPAVPTLAQRLAGAGYQTLGVIGASALDGELGVGRGFAVWDDDLDRKVAVQFEDRAGSVVDRTLGHLASVDPQQPLFLFVHVFDAHAPYDAPGAYRERFMDPDYDGPVRTQGFVRRKALQQLRAGTLDPADRDAIASLYLGEVGYVDHELGRLLDGLGERGLLDHAVVVVTADHGEVLGEDPTFAWSHGRDVTEGTIRVPLLIRGYGVNLGGPGVVQRQAGMASLAPTLERLAGLERTLGAAPDLWDLIRPGPVDDTDGWPGRPTRTVLHEATAPHQERRDGRWNNLGLERGVHAGGASARKLRRRGWVVESGAGAVLPVLRDLMQSWDAAAPPYRSETLSSHTRQALEALGYLSPDTDPQGGTTTGDSPADPTQGSPH